MQIVFNGEAINVSNTCNVYDVLTGHELLKKTSLDQVVVALNGDFVHRQYYSDVLINEGDSIEVLSAVVGG